MPHIASYCLTIYWWLPPRDKKNRIVRIKPQHSNNRHAYAYLHLHHTTIREAFPRYLEVFQRHQRNNNPPTNVYPPLHRCDNFG
jgi:hypothetical protein